MEKVADKLFVGVPKDAEDRADLDGRGIRSILFCSTLFDTPVHGGITCGIIRVADDSTWTEEQKKSAARFIAQMLERGGVLVVSDLGQDRCYTAVNAFLASRELPSIRRPSEIPLRLPEPPRKSKLTPLGDKTAVVSVVTVTFNRLELVKMCVASVLEHTNVPFEMIAVDNHSTDGTVEYLESIPKLDLVKLPQNYGKSRAANLGFERASTQWIAYLDSDIVVPEGWIELLIDAYEHVPYCGWITLPYQGQVLPEVQYYEHIGLAETESVDGGLVFINRAILSQTGGFTQTVRYGEIDTEFTKRAREYGYKVGYVDTESALVHLGGKLDTPAYKAMKERMKHEEPQGWMAEEPITIKKVREQHRMPIPIIIPAYDNVPFTEETLKSLHACTEWPFRVILVDNGSGPEAQAYYQKALAEKKIHHLITNEENLGFPKAINQGFELVDSPYFVIGNNDVIVTPRWLTKLMRAMNHNDRIVISSPLRLQRSPGASKLQICPFQMQKFPGLPSWTFDEAEGIDALQKEVLGYAHRLNDFFSDQNPVMVNQKFAPFFFVLMRSDMFREYGGIDEDFGLGLHEDTYFCELVKGDGWDIAIAADCFIYHFMSRTVIQVFGSWDAVKAKIEENTELKKEKIRQRRAQREEAVVKAGRAS